MPDAPKFVQGRYQTFMGSSKNITRQTPLWRYLTFEKFCWLMEKSILYHARLDQFDDPFEGAVTDEYVRLRNAGKTKPLFSQNKEDEPLAIKLEQYIGFATCWHASEYELDAQWKLYAPGGAGIAVVSTMDRIQQTVELGSHWYGVLGQVEYEDFDKCNMRRRDSFHTIIRPGF